MLPFVTNYGIELPFVALYDSMWPCMIFCGCAFVALLSCIAFSWSCMALEWTFMAFYGRLWQNTDFNGLVSSFLAVIDPNSFGLVFLLGRFRGWVTVLTLISKNPWPLTFEFWSSMEHGCKFNMSLVLTCWPHISNCNVLLLFDPFTL